MSVEEKCWDNTKGGMGGEDDDGNGCGCGGGCGSCCGWPTSKLSFSILLSLSLSLSCSLTLLLPLLLPFPTLPTLSLSPLSSTANRGEPSCIDTDGPSPSSPSPPGGGGSSSSPRSSPCPIAACKGSRSSGSQALGRYREVQEIAR